MYPSKTFWVPIQSFWLSNITNHLLPVYSRGNISWDNQASDRHDILHIICAARVADSNSLHHLSLRKEELGAAFHFGITTFSATPSFLDTDRRATHLHLQLGMKPMKPLGILLSLSLRSKYSAFFFFSPKV